MQISGGVGPKVLGVSVVGLEVEELTVELGGEEGGERGEEWEIEGDGDVL